MSEVMREYVSRKYGKKWVDSKPDNQIVCIYRRLLDEDERKERERVRNQRKDDICGSENYAQH